MGELTCARCCLPITTDTLYVERKDGSPVHWRCSMGLVSDGLDASNGIRTTIGVGADPESKLTK